MDTRRYKYSTSDDKVTNAASACTLDTVLEYVVNAMSWNVRVTCSRQFGNRLSLIKFFFFISCTNLFAFLFWSQETYRQHQSSSTESLVQEAITNVGHDYRYTDLYRKVNTLPEDFKYILLWTEKDYAPFYFYGEGQIAFLKNKCQETKCYVVADRNFFGGNLTRFDAIAFNGRNMNSKDLPKTRSRHQHELLQKDYYFYMSMENSFAEDYVTEKLLTALRNDVVPIVYGGADYNRFLPPGSYIDATKHHVIKLAAMINDAMHSPKLYNQYFWWKKFYTYDTPSKENICALCTALHNKTMIKKNKIYDDFRSWWYPAYAKRCH
ncbi:alpha-(1,3)-fucosyltransferase 9-like isoform X3 [Spodoptera litura]|uniref:Fucosyltransferase n=1 Tax=Spodoptera litura TaxID=69820 RepID=A0A9J7E7S5_SPOLT|nr:alpha-(1,3)-fucosyltransferase 9-like isoform X3 [Spodoptera litura]